MTLKLTKSDLNVARVMDEDEDFIRLEVPKRDDIQMTLDPETGDRFVFIFFFHVKDKRLYRPWEEANA